MRHFLLIFCLISIKNCIRITRVSTDTIVKQGENAELFCMTDEPYERCEWHMPSENKCVYTPNAAKPCSESNVHFNGTDQNCQIVIKEVISSENGKWYCSVVKNGETANSTAFTLTEAMPANVEWKDDVYGSIEIRSDEERPPRVICEAEESRPKGTFTWTFLNEGVELPNNNLIAIEEKENGFVDMAQRYNLTIDPKNHGKTLVCTFTQKDNSGNVLYSAETRIELEIHYLKLSDATPVVKPVKSGEDVEIIAKFQAQPKPQYGDMEWRIIKNNGQEVNIKLQEGSINQIGKYIAAPLYQESKYEYTAKLTIRNASQEENDFDHYLMMSNKLKPSNDPVEFKEMFDVQVDRSVIAPEPANYTTTIVIIVVVVLIILIGVIVIVMYAKNNEKMCFKPSGGNRMQEDQREPLQVQHHPYARPSS